ncbi:hypothetical protein ZOSMA_65G00990 [Zostera marina]|uniref:Uncharacterized protein n=1 Tax=Zostera marina TaxID=29655 RepID=A0A0K9NUY0_ZOSMR|nr:hypothetical protein ZOSMA_65G00990 [Zostera marina]
MVIKSTETISGPIIRRWKNKPKYVEAQAQNT